MYLDGGIIEAAKIDHPFLCENLDSVHFKCGIPRDAKLSRRVIQIFYWLFLPILTNIPAF